MHRLKGIVFLFLILATFSSCEVFNPSEELPAYIKIDSSVYIIDTATGATSHLAVKDAWVSQAEVILGIHPDGTVFPFLPSNGTNFLFEGGVFESGLSSFRIPYSFWKPIPVTIDIQPGDTFVFHPVYETFGEDVVNYTFDEDFELSAFEFTNIATTDSARFFRTGADAFTGTKSGKANFSSGHTTMEIISAVFENPLQINRDAWAEITYRSDVEFRVGLYYELPGGVGKGAEVTFLPSPLEWNTINVHLVQIMRFALSQNAINIRLWIKAEGNSGSFWLDNVNVYVFR